MSFSRKIESRVHTKNKSQTYILPPFYSPEIHIVVTFTTKHTCTQNTRLDEMSSADTEKSF